MGKGRFNRKPKIKMTEEIKSLTELPDESEEEINQEVEKYSEEQFSIIKKKFEQANRTIGFQPITAKMIEDHIKEMDRDNKFAPGLTHQKKFDTATLSKVQHFMKDVMDIKQPTRSQINIKRVFNSPKQDWNIVYAELETREDLSLITSHAKFIKETPPGIPKNKMLDYVPKPFQARFNALEKLACDIRRQSSGSIQTNIRKSQTDFVLRTRERCQDPTSWNDITPTELPRSLPRFEVQALKEIVQAEPPSTNEKPDDSKIKKDKKVKDKNKKLEEKNNKNKNIKQKSQVEKKQIVADTTINADINGTEHEEEYEDDDMVDNDEDKDYHKNDDQYETPNTSQLSEQANLERMERRAELLEIEEFQKKCMNTSTQLPVALAPELEKALNGNWELKILTNIDAIDNNVTPKRKQHSPDITNRPIKAHKESSLDPANKYKQTVEDQQTTDNSTLNSESQENKSENRNNT
jgi:hypothetical protein